MSKKDKDKCDDWCPETTLKKFPECMRKYGGKCSKGNPGNIHGLHMLAHKVIPKFFDGIELNYIHRIAINKILTNNWVLSHTSPSGYRIGAIYTFHKADGVLFTPTIYANINPSTLSSNFGFLLYPRAYLKIEGDLQRASMTVPLQTQFSAELTRPCAMYTVNLYNINRSAGRSTLSIMRSFTNHLALGAELLLEWSNSRIVADTALAARYKRYNYAVAATASRLGCDISYWQRLHPYLQMATILAWNRKNRRAISSISYHWDFGDAVVQGKVDSELAVGCSYLRYLNDLPLFYGVSVLYSIPQSRFIFGLKLNLDPSGLRRGD